MTKTMRVLWLLLGVLLTSSGCTVLDGDDKADLEAAIVKAPREDRTAMAAMMLSSKTRAYLEGKPPTSTVGTVRCRNTYEDGTSSDWVVEGSKPVLVSDVLYCMGKGVSYLRCVGIAGDLAERETLKAVIKAYESIDLPDDHPIFGAVIECQWTLNPGFEPSQVPGATDDVNRVAAGDLVEWFLTLPAPPSGLSAATWRALGPVLCALDVAWGCAPGLGSGGVITPAPSGGTGDYP